MLNRRTNQQRTAWETVSKLACNVHWEILFDLEKGYMQVGLDDCMRAFYLFTIGLKVFRYRVLHFGLAAVHRDFSK